MGRDLSIRCFCSALLCVEDGLVVCTGGHVYALVSAIERMAAADPKGEMR